MLLTRVTGPLDESELHDRIFDGEILVFEGFDDAFDVIRLGRRHLQTAFGDVAPETAHQTFPTDDLKRRLMAARRAYADDPAVVRSFEALLVRTGLNPLATYRDRLILRTVPPAPDLENDPRIMLPPHRDTWGSGLLAQINWWMPLDESVAGRTMLLWPDLFRRAVRNNSAGWDWRRAREPGYPRLPSVEGTDDDRTLPGLMASAVQLEVPAGALVAFSGAHLHATEINRTDRPRFSTDTRTVSREQLRSGAGAPDVDHGPVSPAYEWFHRLGDGAALEVAG